MRLASWASLLALALPACAASPTPRPTEVVEVERAPSRADLDTPPAVPRREVALGDVRVSEPESTVELRGAFVAYAHATAGCWAPRRARLAFDLVVGVQGNVVWASVTGDDDRAARCAHDAVAPWIFPASGEPLRVTATLVPDADAAVAGVASGVASAPSLDGGAAPFARGGSASPPSVDVRACAEPGGPRGAGHVWLVFANDGTVTRATVDTAPFAGTRTATCVEERFRALRVRPFSGPSARVGKSFVVN